MAESSGAGPAGGRLPPGLGRGGQRRAAATAALRRGAFLFGNKAAAVQPIGSQQRTPLEAEEDEEPEAEEQRAQAGKGVAQDGIDHDAGLQECRTGMLARHHHRNPWA